MSDAGPVSRALGRIAEVEPREVKAVVISFVYFFFLLASYFILRPLRDTMGTGYPGGTYRHVFYVAEVTKVNRFSTYRSKHGIVTS